MTTTILASFPSPSQGVWHLGPIPLRAYALFIIVGSDRRIVHRQQALGGPRRRARRHLRHRPVGGPLRLDRRPAVPRAHRLDHVLRARRRGSVGGLQDPGGRPRDLGCGGAGWRRRLDRLSAQGHSAARLRRCDRARNRAGPGDRPDRQLLQPGALRQDDDRCRGVWRSSSAAMRTAHSIRSTGCRPVS